MAAKTPLTNLELVDCARANAKAGLTTAAELCGYGTDVTRFQGALKQACDKMGVEFHELSDLVKAEPNPLELEGEIVAPDSANQL